MAKSVAPVDRLPKPSGILANTIAKHIMFNKAYPKKLPAIPSVLKSLPAIMRNFGGRV